MCSRPLPRDRALPRWPIVGSVLLAAGLLVAGSGTLAQDGQEKRPSVDRERADVRVFMNQKLTHVQEAMRGIVTRDFQKIADSSRAISLLCIEEQWNRVVSEGYLQRSTAFRRTANQMARAADEENLDGTSLHFIRLSSQCFECHDYIHRLHRLEDEDEDETDRFPSTPLEFPR